MSTRSIAITWRRLSVPREKVQWDLIDHDNPRFRVEKAVRLCFPGKTSVVRKLAELRADVNRQDTQGCTALMWAVMKRHIRTVHALLEIGVNTARRDRHGSTALDHATMLCFSEIEQLLKSRSDAERSKLLMSQAEFEASRAGGDAGAVEFGDMETLLAGLGLGELIAVFRAHDISMAHFLRMNDSELQSVVAQAGARRKLVDAIDRLNKKPWKTSSVSGSDSSLFTKRVSCSEALFMMQNIKNHLAYITSTVAYVNSKVDAQVLRGAADGAGGDQLLCHSREALNVVCALHSEVASFNHSLTALLQKPEAKPPDLIEPVAPPASRGASQATSAVRYAFIGSATTLLVLYFSRKFLRVYWIGISVFSEHFMFRTVLLSTRRFFFMFDLDETELYVSVIFVKMKGRLVTSNFIEHKFGVRDFSQD